MLYWNTCILNFREGSFSGYKGLEIKAYTQVTVCSWRYFRSSTGAFPQSSKSVTSNADYISFSIHHIYRWGSTFGRYLYSAWHSASYLWLKFLNISPLEILCKNFHSVHIYLIEKMFCQYVLVNFFSFWWLSKGLVWHFGSKQICLHSRVALSALYY